MIQPVCSNIFHVKSYKLMGILQAHTGAMGYNNYRDSYRLALLNGSNMLPDRKDCSGNF